MSQVDHKQPPGAATRPTFWRTLDELAGTPEFRDLMQREFAEPLENLEEPPNSPGRRRFMQLMGASFAFAGVATGCRWEQEKILPHTRRPQGLVPGETRAYTTAMELEGVAVGLVATSYDGRPIKVDGNPLHPDSDGATNVYQQASILGLYDPDRAQQPTRRDGGRRVPVIWEDVDRFAGEHFAKLRGAGGQGLRILVGSSSSPSRADLRQRVLNAYPQARWVEYEPVNRDQERAGTRLAFGTPHRPLLQLDRATVVVCLDADPLVQHPAGVVNARRLMAARNPDQNRMSRVYAIESAFSATGTVADHRLPLRAELVKAFAMALDAEVSSRAQPLPEHGPAQSRPNAAFLEDAAVAAMLKAMAADLLAHVGASIVIAGPGQPPEVHAIAHRLNVLLGNVGQTIQYVAEPEAERPDHAAALRQLVDEMQAGAVDTLVVLGGNPAYDAPSDVPFASALAKVKTTIRSSLYVDETSALVDWHLPATHFLETWSDGRASDGTLTLAQPLIAPLHGGRSELEILALMVDDTVRTPLEIVRRTHGAQLRDRRRWERAVHDGMVAGTAWLKATPKLQPLAPITLSDRERGGVEVGNGQLELTIAPDPKVYDGRYANNAWLQELPDPVTKLTWDNAVLIAPATAAALGVDDGEVVTIQVGERSLTLPALLAPGQARGSLRITLGYGRTRAGVVAGSETEGVAPVGASAYAVRTTAAPHVVGNVKVTPTGRKTPLATTQHLHAIDQLGREGEASRLGMIVREATLARVQDPHYDARHEVHHPKLLSLWQDPVAYDGRKWGMSIDLTKCIGCNACVISCQAENNIPVVGKEQVLKGREMAWIRIDRYYSGEPDHPTVAHQPVACQHCENAPCEQVCPVGATMHSSEGLNDMVYNRCIGTRYCSNNCPYKVRRFNYFNFNLSYQDPKNQVQKMALNPDVTVRSRGVMEKCSFCVQRIQNGKIKAKNARRPLVDGEILTACQQACPTRAIVFGDLNDTQAQVVEQRQSRRSYALLGELNNRPRIEYLSRVTNPHPDLDQTAAGGGHGDEHHGAEHDQEHG